MANDQNMSKYGIPQRSGKLGKQPFLYNRLEEVGHLSLEILKSKQRFKGKVCLCVVSSREHFWFCFSKIVLTSFTITFKLAMAFNVFGEFY